MPSSFVFDSFKGGVLTSGAGLNWKWDDNSVSLYMLLVSGTFNGTNDNTVESDVTGWEVVSASYARKAVTGVSGGGTRSVILQPTNNRALYDAVDVVFPAINNCTVAGAIIFNSGGGTPATNKLLCYLTGTNLPVVCNGGDLTMVFAPSGVFMISGT